MTLDRGAARDLHVRQHVVLEPAFAGLDERLFLHPAKIFERLASHPRGVDHAERVLRHPETHAQHVHQRHLAAIAAIARVEASRVLFDQRPVHVEECRQAGHDAPS
jgi:hypothetical protein